jgi:hypothetical protein
MLGPPCATFVLIRNEVAATPSRLARIDHPHDRGFLFESLFQNYDSHARRSLKVRYLGVSVIGCPKQCLSGNVEAILQSIRFYLCFYGGPSVKERGARYLTCVR